MFIFDQSRTLYNLNIVLSFHHSVHFYNYMSVDMSNFCTINAYSYDVNVFPNEDLWACSWNYDTYRTREQQSHKLESVHLRGLAICFVAQKHIP